MWRIKRKYLNAMSWLWMWGSNGTDKAQECVCALEIFSPQPTFTHPTTTAQTPSPLGSRHSSPAYFQFLVFQRDAFTMLPEENLSGTRAPLHIKKTTATVWPHSKHWNPFSFNFSRMMNKGQKQAGHESKFIIRSVVLTLDVSPDLQWSCSALFQCFQNQNGLNHRLSG